MPIPEQQLEIWSHQGSVTQSSNTYNAIKSVLESASAPYAGKDYEVFLQGSYGNDTNIYAESDVDIVIKSNECWHRDLTNLAPEDKAAYEAYFPVASYTYRDFKRDVLKVLRDAYGADVTEGKKAIAIAANGSRRKADVIVAVQYRRYFKFKNVNDQSYDEGICFFTASGILVANYPKQHSAHLTAKHQATGKWLKPTIRVLKNMRSKLVDTQALAAGVAPSYYLEGLWYNVPIGKYGTTYQKSIEAGLAWIQNEADKSKLLCANEQYYLLRANAETCWSPSDAEAFLQAATKLWENW